MYRKISKISKRALTAGLAAMALLAVCLFQLSTQVARAAGNYGEVAPAQLVPPDQTTVTSSVAAPFSGIVHDFVTAEDVELEGNVHIVARVTFLSDGSIQYDLHTNIFNAHGTGIDSDARYSATGADSIEIVMPGLLGAGSLTIEVHPRWHIEGTDVCGGCGDGYAPPDRTLTLVLVLSVAETGHFRDVYVREVFLPER